MSDSHLWMTGPDRESYLAAAAACEPDAAVDCNRRRRGPYTGAGSLMRALVPGIHARDPLLTQQHAIEILAVAPELEPLLGPAPGTLTSLAPPTERTRWYSRYRTRRIAHGLVDFLRASASCEGLTLVLSSAEHADPTDLEFISIALRRLDPARVRLVICSGAEIGRLTEALSACCRHEAAAASLDGNLSPVEPGIEEAAAAYVSSDGTSDCRREREAYLQADPALRARLHDERAAELERAGEWSLKLGAIPYHREHGSRPGTQARAAYAVAVDYCIGMAFYDAGLELSGCLAQLIDAASEPKAYYLAQAQKCQCLAMLERPAETEPLYYDLLARGDDPARHMNVSYALAILYTRLYDPGHKDHKKALAHINTAVAIASQLPDPQDRAFHTVFMNNGKALVEMHLGNLNESLRLVEEGIDRLGRELPPDKHLLHRSVLNHNRANVYAALGRTEEALADFDRVIAMDPNYPEYHFDRANLLYKLGRHAEALADYEAAMRLDPPFPELYYNRGDLRSATGDIDGAMADFRYVLDLEPDYLDATVSLASILLDTDDPQAAAAQVQAGIELSPDEPRLHCTLGLALLDMQDYRAAAAAFDRALDLDPQLVQARVNRAVAAFEQGDYATARRDLTAALEADPANPDLLYNRGRLHEADGRFADAVADYTKAMEDPEGDAPELLYRRGRCHLALGNLAEAHADVDAHLALGESAHADEIPDLLVAVSAR